MLKIWCIHEASSVRKPKLSNVLPQKKYFVKSVRKQYGNLDSHVFFSTALIQFSANLRYVRHPFFLPGDSIKTRPNKIYGGSEPERHESRARARQGLHIKFIETNPWCRTRENHTCNVACTFLLFFSIIRVNFKRTVDQPLFSASLFHVNFYSVELVLRSAPSKEKKERDSWIYRHHSRASKQTLILWSILRASLTFFLFTVDVASQQHRCYSFIFH